MALALLLALGLGLAALGWLGARHLRKRRESARLMAMPLDDRQRAMLVAQVPLVAKLPEELRPGFEGKINRFLAEVDFGGYNGLEVTEEMRLSIAGQACLLIANSDRWYEHLTSILLYPGAFRSRQSRRQGYVVTEEETVRLGESWGYGPVVLSWAHSAAGASDPEDGHNVVFHEFAHRIDGLSGATNGIPVLSKGQRYADWEKAFLEGFARHRERVEQGRHTVLDPYGAESHEEFFAVSVESFFERPEALRRDEPAIYEQLAQLFRLDPAGWR